MKLFNSKIDILKELTSALCEKRGFSVLRLGDGEARLLMWSGEKITKEITWVIRSVLGFNGKLLASEILDFKIQSLNTILYSDALFVYKNRDYDNYIKYREGLLAVLCDNGIDILNISPLNVVNDILNESDVIDLLRVSNNVHLLTCRGNAKDILVAKEPFLRKKIKNILIPSESKFRDLYEEPQDVEMTSQFPELMKHIRETVLPEQILPGDIVLIGAGPAKFMYADVVKSRGAVALDVGHFFDSICGFVTRGKQEIDNKRRILASATQASIEGDTSGKSDDSFKEIYQEPNGSNLFLAFSGLAQEYAIPQFEFENSLLKADAGSIFLLKDPMRRWYQAGVPGVGRTVHDIVRYLRNKVTRVTPGRFLSIGSSAGGYAAILFGCMLGADMVIAFGPQTFLDKKNRTTYGDGRWESAIRKISDSEYLDLYNLVRDSPKTKVIIMVGSKEPIDIIHGLYLKGLKNVTLLIEKSSKHNCAKTLKEQGLLSDFIQSVSSTEYDESFLMTRFNNIEKG